MIMIRHVASPAPAMKSISKTDEFHHHTSTHMYMSVCLKSMNRNTKVDTIIQLYVNVYTCINMKWADAVCARLVL